MLYELMNRNVSVCDISMDSKGQIKELKKNKEMQLMPICVRTKDGISENRLRRWYALRMIPKDRQFFSQLQNNLRTEFIGEILMKNHGFSLYDQYWIKEQGENITWEENNYYKNSYSNETAVCFSKGDFSHTIRNLQSPDYTTPEKEIMVWQQTKEGKNQLFLFHDDEEYIKAERFLSCHAMELFGLEHVSMTMGKQNEKPYLCMDQFTAENIEYVPAYVILNTGERLEGESSYDHFLKRCRIYKIPNYQRFLDTMLCFDFIFHNTDRNYYNFGFLRNMNNGSFIGPAPLYHNGYGLYNLMEMKNNKNRINPIFNQSIDENISKIKRAEDLTINFEELPNIVRIFEENGGFFNEERRAAITEMLRRRISTLPTLLIKNIEQKTKRFYDLDKEYKQKYILTKNEIN